MRVKNIVVAFNGPGSKDIVDAYAIAATNADTGEQLTDEELEALSDEMVQAAAFDQGGWH